MKHVHLKIGTGRRNTCYLSSKVLRDLGLSSGRSYSIIIGHAREEVIIKELRDGKRKLYFPPRLFKDLSIPSEITLNIWKTGDDIYLGPLVGIFVNQNVIYDIEDRIPRVYIQKDIQANTKGKCLIFYYTLEGINWVNKTIQGYTYIQGPNQWRLCTFPFPSVIYDCGVGFEVNQKPIVKFIRQQFMDNRNTSVINARDYLGKWELYEKLSQYKKVKRLLPETVPFESSESLKDMLSRHSLIFVKSYYGSKGKEVMSIEKQKDGYTLVHFERDVMKRLHLKSLDDVLQITEKFMGDKHYIIQQGIDVLTYKKSKFDMRVLIAKKKKGNWKAIYNQANLAQAHSTVTTINGGVKNYHDIYLEYEGVKNGVRLPSDKEIRKKTLLVAKYIEKEFGSFGELGMDMAVDKEGKIWFIEANTKPEKNPIPGVEDTRGISPQFLATFEYAKYLAKKNPISLGEKCGC